METVKDTPSLISITDRGLGIGILGVTNTRDSALISGFSISTVISPAGSEAVPRVGPSTATVPTCRIWITSNTGTLWNNNWFYDGLMAEFIVMDGADVIGTFGETDANGDWVPKKLLSDLEKITQRLEEVL